MENINLDVNEIEQFLEMVLANFILEYFLTSGLFLRYSFTLSK